MRCFCVFRLRSLITNQWVNLSQTPNQERASVSERKVPIECVMRQGRSRNVFECLLLECWQVFQRHEHEDSLSPSLQLHHVQAYITLTHLHVPSFAISLQVECSLFKRVSIASVRRIFIFSLCLILNYSSRLSLTIRPFESMIFALRCDFMTTQQQPVRLKFIAWAPALLPVELFGTFSAFFIFSPET